MKTYRADYQFIKKEYGEGTGAAWCLECYPKTSQLPFIARTGCMYINFKVGVSEAIATEIARLLNENVVNVAVVS